MSSILFHVPGSSDPPSTLQESPTRFPPTRTKSKVKDPPGKEKDIKSKTGTKTKQKNMYWCTVDVLTWLYNVHNELDCCMFYRVNLKVYPFSIFLKGKVGDILYFCDCSQKQQNKPTTCLCLETFWLPYLVAGSHWYAHYFLLKMQIFTNRSQMINIDMSNINCVGFLSVMLMDSMQRTKEMEEQLPAQKNKTKTAYKHIGKQNKCINK